MQLEHLIFLFLLVVFFRLNTDILVLLDLLHTDKPYQLHYYPIELN